MMIKTRTNLSERLALRGAALALQSRRGVTLVLVVMLLVLLQVAVVGTVTSSARQVDLMTVGYQGVQANYRAEGLLQRGIREAVRNTDEDGNGTIGTVGAAMGSSLTRTTSGNDSILTGTVAVGDVTRSLQYRWTVVQPVAASGMPLLEFYNSAGPMASIPFNGTPAATTSVSGINFPNSLLAAYRGGPATYLSMRVTGNIRITTPGTYRFVTESDDGSDFWLSGSRLINMDSYGGMRTTAGTTVLAAGTYPFVGRFFQGGGPWGYRLYWRPPGGSADVLIPPTVLSGSGPSRGVTAHTGISLNASSQLTAWARSGLAGGVAAVTNATTNNGTTTGIDIRNSAVLLGDVRVGVGSTVATVLRQYQSGAWTGTGTALSVRAAVARVSMPIVPGTSLGNVSLGGSTSTSYGPGTVRVTSLVMTADSWVTINGETVLIIDGALTMSNQARIQLAAGANLRMYVGGNVSMAGTAHLNGQSSRSPDLRLFMTSTGTPTFSMLNNAVFCGALQNPNGTVSITNDSTFFGTIEADRVTLDNQARIFADVSATTGGSSIASATLVYFTDLTLPN